MKPIVATEAMAPPPAARTTCRRRLVAALGLVAGLLVASSASAVEEWRLFAQLQEDRGAIDLASIERSENLFFVDYRLTLVNAIEARFGPGSVSELRKKLALSCGQAQVAVVEVRELDAQGVIIGRGEVSREQWKFFEPAAGGMEWKIRQLVCRTYADRARKIDVPAAGGRPPAASGATGELLLRPARVIEARLPVE